MTLTEALKVAERLSLGNRWIVWNDTFNELVVYERKPYAKITRTVIETNNEELASEIDRRVTHWMPLPERKE